MVDEKSVGIVILNYNTYELTCNLADKCLGMSIFDKIIIVDNNSDDDFTSYVESKKACTLFYIKTNNNGGYAKGNNAGLKYLNEQKIDYAFIANPDVIFDKKAIVEITRFLLNHNDFAVASCSRTQAGNKLTGQFWWIPDFKYTIFESLYVGRRIIDKTCIRKTNNLKISDASYETVEVVGGAFFGCNLKHISDMGFLDEGTFLWYEENILAYRLREIGLKEAFLKNCSYIHNHQKHGRGNRNFDIFLRSKRHYCYNYLKINYLQRIILAVFDLIGLIEEKIICFLFMKRG